MQYSSALRLNDVIRILRSLEKDLYNLTHEAIAEVITNVRLEIGNIVEED